MRWLSQGTRKRTLFLTKGKDDCGLPRSWPRIGSGETDKFRASAEDYDYSENLWRAGVYHAGRGQETITLMSKQEIENKIATFTGGRAAEEVMFGSVTTGAANNMNRRQNLPGL